MSQVSYYVALYRDISRWSFVSTAEFYNTIPPGGFSFRTFAAELFASEV